MWCLERSIHIIAQCLPGTENTIADAESQSQIDRTDLSWIPQCISQDTGNVWHTGSKTLHNLLSAQCNCYFNWCLDPSPEATDTSILTPRDMSIDLEIWYEGYSPPKSHHSACCTSAEIQNMVPYTPTHVDRLPEADSRDNDQQRQLTDTSTTSHLLYLRERHRSQQLSQEATELKLSSWRTKTNMYYNSLFVK